MVINIQDDLLKIHKLGLLDKLLIDKTTKKNIMWATNAYCSLGARYERNEAITPELITGPNASVIKTRARKAMEQQSERTRQHAEVFTPLWICRKMNDYADEVWFGSGEVFFREGRPTPEVVFPPKKNWKKYVDSKRLEITCGEAPYLASRYDVETGEMIPIPKRVGLLDRKLRVVNENAQDEAEWLEWAVRAFQVTYGFEFQGDNVLIARVNLLMTFEEYLQARWEREPTEAEWEKLINTIVWNIWQMDGLSGTIPYGTAEEEFQQMDLFGMFAPTPDAKEEDRQPNCRILNWCGDGGRSSEYLSLKRKGHRAMDTVSVDENGEVEIPTEIVVGKAQGLFGEKLYEDISHDVQEQVEAVAESNDVASVGTQVKSLAGAIKDSLKEKVLAPVVENYGMKKGAQARLERQVERDIDRAFEQIQGDYEQQARIAQAELERKQREAETEQEVAQAESAFKASMDSAMQAFMETVQETVQRTIEEKPKEVIEQMERHKAEQEKRTVEEEVRAHLRGFSRTIPSFIMAYGDGNLTLANFDDYTEDDVFLEVTGITEDDFRFLRDGGEYQDPETGETEWFEGHLFDEVVFNDSVEEFWKKKLQLADYFDESQEEDIFDYIPPQKTNQIFTPKWVVSMMVDQLEENNPGCFDDPTKKFADLYMKSGLYITEIVKRLYRSEGLKAAYPDERERIRHIFQEQVFGMAPTRIIYLIATNYILGFDEELKHSIHNFVEADAAEASKQGTLDALVEQHFGK